MRGKRSKQYRKLIQQYSIHFGFREPYQVLVDADFVRDTTKCKMDLLAALERTFHGTVKPLITQCSIRHLYATNTEPSVAAAIEIAKTVCERRRCGHHPESHPQPLSTLECLSSVVDPAKNGSNKHRYCVASQDVDVRRAMRGVKGVPLVYVNRSVMIMEPMAEETRRVCESGEKGKLRDGFVRNLKGKGAGEKRKREADESGSGREGEDGDMAAQQQDAEKKRKKKKYGPKQPNPLSVQKPKKKTVEKKTAEQEKADKEVRDKKFQEREARRLERGEAPTVPTVGGEGSTETKPKRKRRRRHKAAGGESGGAGGDGVSAQADAVTEAATGEAVEA